MSSKFNLDIFEKILKLNIGVSQPDNQEMFKLLNTIVPIKLYKFKTGSENNGWVIPHSWIVHKALIKHKGKVVFDGTCHPMAVAGYSSSFTGNVSKDELEKHVFYREEQPKAYTFHCMNYYRPWVSEWGFCVPFNQWITFPDGDYNIELVTEYKEGEMLVGEVHHKGVSTDTIVFNAHTCHPCQFNDDMSGVSVLLELFKWLKKRGKTKFSYRAVLAPEHIGTHFYLSKLPKKEISTLKAGAFVEMAGISNRFALQRSFHGTNIIDEVAESVLKEFDPGIRVGAFRTIVGNDETVWEGPGVEIPFISISRCFDSPHYFDEYHTNFDNLSANSVSKMDECLEVLKKMVLILEEDCSIKRKFTGLVALSNPRYDLYVQRPEPGMKKSLTSSDLKLGPLQDVILRYFDGKYSIFQLSRKFELSFDGMKEYLSRFEKKGLVKLVPVKKLSYYQS